MKLAQPVGLSAYAAKKSQSDDRIELRKSARSGCSHGFPSSASIVQHDVKLDSVVGMHNYHCFARGSDFMMFFRSSSHKLCVSPKIVAAGCCAIN
jgi:hypothetical protein